MSSTPTIRSATAIPLRQEHLGLAGRLSGFYGLDEAEVTIDVGFSYLSGGRLSALIPARGLFIRLAPVKDRHEVVVRHRCNCAILRRLGPPHAAGCLREFGDFLGTEYAIVPGSPAGEATPALIEANLRTLARLLEAGRVLGLERGELRLIHHDLGPANTLVEGPAFYVIDYDSFVPQKVDWALGRLMLNAMLDPVAGATAERQARCWELAAGPILAFARHHARMRDEADLARQTQACIAALERWIPRFAPYGSAHATALATAAGLIGQIAGSVGGTGEVSRF